MKLKVSVKSGREFVKRAMLSTMGITELSNPQKFEKAMKKPLSDNTWKQLLIGRHSPIEEYEIWVEAIVPERVHTHVIRHKELGKYVATSRPDISYQTPLNKGERSLSLRINAKRLIEISWARLCSCAWCETSQMLFEIKKEKKLIFF